MAEVETSLLTTKLNIPPTRPNLVARSSLVKRLHEGLNYDLILISAPAGFGKTTLLSEWVHDSKPVISTAWVSLDEGDNDPVRFWDYFITALQTLQPDCGEKILPILHSSPQPSFEPILTTLINDLSAIVGDFIVVLDDYHLIDSQQIHDGITYLLEHIPSQMHLVLATRADPPLHLAHLRGRGTLMAIGADDLRFTLEDAASLLKELKIPELSSEDIAALNERTEGWAVGLKMAALSMGGQKDISGFITAFTGSHRYVMDYLMEEVLQKQTPEFREFLCKTSILKRLSARLCDTVTGREGSQAILLELERGHLFIVPLDESRQWYRYEHLFSDLLQHQCQTAYGTEFVTSLHQKASQWYKDNNLPDDAIYHSLVVKDWEMAMRLIYARCEELRKRGEWNTLLGWLEIIPEEILRTHYRLYSQYASYLTVVSRFDAAEAALSYLANEAHDDADIQGEVAFSLSNLARLRGDFPRMVDMAEKALLLLPPDNIAMRSRATFNIGNAQYESGLFHEAEVRMTDAYEMAQQAGDYWVAGSALNTLGAITHQRGSLRRAAEILKRAIEASGQSQMASGPQCKLGRVQYEWNDLEAAAENERQSTEWYELGGVAEASIVAYFFQAQICLARGDMIGVAAAMEGMDRASRDPTVSAFYRARCAVGHVVVAIRQQALEEAADWGRELSEYIDILQPEFQHVPARLMIAHGKNKEAAEYLGDLHERLVGIDAHGLAIAVRVCQALAADTEAAALEFLSDALIKGEPEGFIRSFVDEGRLLVPLLEKALSLGVTPKYTGKLIGIIEAEERQKQKRKRGEEGTPSTSQSILSERELEVLRLMAEGLSNQQIADRLIISTSTTKNHVHNILQKLDAQGRTQAIALARELELI